MLSDPASSLVLSKRAASAHQLQIRGRNHRLLCGDSASAADIDTLLAGAAIHLVNTDPRDPKPRDELPPPA